MGESPDLHPGSHQTAWEQRQQWGQETGLRTERGQSVLLLQQRLVVLDHHFPHQPQVLGISNRLLLGKLSLLLQPPQAPHQPGLLLQQPALQLLVRLLQLKPTAPGLVLQPELDSQQQVLELHLQLGLLLLLPVQQQLLPEQEPLQLLLLLGFLQQLGHLAVLQLLLQEQLQLELLQKQQEQLLQEQLQ